MRDKIDVWVHVMCLHALFFCVLCIRMHTRAPCTCADLIAREVYAIRARQTLDPRSNPHHKCVRICVCVRACVCVCVCVCVC